MIKKIALIRGDGIGPEIVGTAVRALDAVAGRFGHKFEYVEAPMGGCAVDRFGVPLPDESLRTCLESDGVLLGAVGGPKWDAQPPENRPEKGLLKLRKGMGLFANIRPAKLFPGLEGACPLRADIAAGGIDFVVVRELTGGIYFGEHREYQKDGEAAASDTAEYTEGEIRRVARTAFELAMTRRRRLVSVDKANVLVTSRLWRSVVDETAEEFPDVEYSHMYVDNAAMQMVKNPAQFDVMLTENMFGDILTDEASQIAGSIGMIPSASLGRFPGAGTGSGGPGLYEPIHGSAPDIAGQDKANPIGTILAAAMMLRIEFGMNSEADAAEDAVRGVVKDGYRTADIASASASAQGGKVIGCREMGERIADKIRN